MAHCLRTWKLGAARDTTMTFLETLSGLALRHLPREHFLTLRKRYHGMRRRLHPLLKRMYGTFDTRELRFHLERRIGRNHEILMVHSSFNHMLPMFTGTALELVNMLIELCGEERTLVMPAFYFGETQAADVAAHYRQHPVFDVTRTPSQMGIVSELFRRSQGVCQSLHPTHRVAARGPLAQALTSGHAEAGTACGAGTPFEFMAKRNTRILGVGKPFEVLTQVHHVEDLLGDAFPVPAQTTKVQITLRDRDKQKRPFELRWRRFAWHRDMYRLRRVMGPESLQEWTFHHVPFFATSAGDVTRALSDAATSGFTLYQETH